MFRFAAQRFRAGHVGLAFTFMSLVFLARHWTTKAETNPPLAGEPAPVVVKVDVRPGLLLSGSVAALNAVSLTAPRILGSRSGFNRGGDGAGGGGGDFNLVLLSLADPGRRGGEGHGVAQFYPENQIQRRDDYRGTVVQMENQLNSGTAALDSTVE